MGLLVGRLLHFKLFFHLGQPKHIFFFFLISEYVAITYRKSSQSSHVMSNTKLKSAGPALFALFKRLCFHEETRFGSLPISIVLFLWGERLLWLSVIFRHKGAHLKRLNANLISYKKHSWFIFAKLFFLSRQTTSQPISHIPSWLELHLSASSQRNREVLCGWLPPYHPHTHICTPAPRLTYPLPCFPFPPVNNSTAGVEPSPKIAEILTREKVLETSFILYSGNCFFTFILGKAGRYTLLSVAVAFFVCGCLCFFLCVKDLKLAYLSQNQVFFKYLHWLNWLSV